MSDLVERYFEAANSFAVVYRNFVLWSSKRKDHLLCAVEGQDHMYYDPRVRAVIPELSSSYFHMGGRANVLELLDLALKNPALSGLKIAFFVDGDFGRPNNVSDCLYVTPGYSIENHYVSREAFRRLLGTAFDMRELVRQGSVWQENKELNRILDFCCQVMNVYGQTIGVQLNAFLLAAYKSATEQGQSRHSLRTKDFDQQRFQSLFEITHAGFVPNIELTYETLLREYKTTAEFVTERHFTAALEQLRTVDAIQVGRGKFLFAVLLALLDFLRSDGRRTKPKVFSCKQPCKYDESGLPLATLSSFADTPPELTAFLRRLRSIFGIDSLESPGK